MERLTKYLINTMTEEINDEELNFYFNSLTSLELEKSKIFEGNFQYDAKFYKLPIIKY